ncbi:glycosyltransferase [Rossellomorea vietnamensis]|uniref:glycosyltransferase n=1 Tax=Rossellomorea vietnamensis TaxID=218284 RepID=UPI003CF5068B
MVKKVLVISNMFPSEFSKSFGIFVKNQVDEIRKNNIEVDVIAISDYKMNKLSVIRKYFRWILSFISNLVFKGHKYDVIHAHYVFPSGILALIYKIIYRKKVVITAHGGDINDMASRSRINNFFTKIILEKCDHIIAVSDDLKKTILLKYHISSQKITVLSMGVNRSIFYPKDTPIKSKILFVGNVIRSKGVKELIDAIKQERFDGLDFLLIGEKKDSRFFNEIENEIKVNNLSNIKFMDTMPQDKVATYMNESVALILPSYNEGFGLVALEAMSCNTLVIGSEVGGLSSLLKEHCGIMIQPKSAAEIADSIKYVLDESNEDRIKVLKRNGLKQAQKHDSALILEKLFRIYQEE